MMGKIKERIEGKQPTKKTEAEAEAEAEDGVID